MKINLLVLFGGKSTEHEISIISALQAIENLDKEKYNIYPVYIHTDCEFYYHKTLLLNSKNYRNINDLLGKCQKVCLIKNKSRVYLKYIHNTIFHRNEICIVDVALPIVHGTNVEDGNLQGYLHTFNLPYVGCDCLSSSIGMDKYIMKKFFQAEDLPVINGILYKEHDFESIDKLVLDIESKIRYPVMIKPVNLGSSIGISKANDRERLLNAIQLAFSFSDNILIEKALDNMREFNCAILGNTDEQIVSLIEEPFGNDEILSFSDKYMSNQKNKINNFTTQKIDNIGQKSGMASLKRKLPADIDKMLEKNIKDLSVRVFKVLRCCGVCRIDYLYDLDEKKLYINEINTMPGSLSYYLFEKIDINYKTLLDKIIKIAIDRLRKQNRLIYNFDKTVF